MLTGMQAGKNEVENNYLTRDQIKDKQDALKKADTNEKRQQIEQDYAALDKQQQKAAEDCLLSGNCTSVMINPQMLKSVLAELSASCAPPRICSADTQSSINQINTLLNKADGITPVYTAEELLLGNKIISSVVKSLPAVWARLAGTEESATLAAAKGGGAQANLEAQNIANAQRLANDLRLQSANSPFAVNGTLTQDAINSAKAVPGLGPGQLSNPAIPPGFGKYTTETFQSPAGNFQMHFYKNPTTGEVLYSVDYKAVFNNMSGVPKP